MKNYEQTFIDNLIDIGNEYHLDVALHEDRGKDYVVASIYNIPNDIDAYETARKVKNHGNLFYPTLFAIRIEEDNLALITNKVLDYAKKSELARTLFPEYGLDVPEVLTTQEINLLMQINYSRFSEDLSSDMQMQYGLAMDKFFREEKDEFTHKWRLSKRNVKFNDDTTDIKQSLEDSKKKSNEVSIEMMLKNSDKLETIGLPEYRYQEFKKFINEYYPDVIYYAHNKDVVDWGTPQMPEGEENPFKDQQRYFETRKITFRESDAELVYRVLNSFMLEKLETPTTNAAKIYERGDFEVINVPLEDIQNVYSLAKANDVIIYLDKGGTFTPPTSETIGVAFCEFDKPMMTKIMDRIADEKTKFSHVISNEQRPALQKQLEAAKDRYAHNQPRSYTPNALEKVAR